MKGRSKSGKESEELVVELRPTFNSRSSSPIASLDSQRSAPFGGSSDPHEITSFYGQVRIVNTGGSRSSVVASADEVSDVIERSILQPRTTRARLRVIVWRVFWLLTVSLSLAISALHLLDALRDSPRLESYLTLSMATVTAVAAFSLGLLTRSRVEPRSPGRPPLAASVEAPAGCEVPKAECKSNSYAFPPNKLGIPSGDPAAPPEPKLRKCRSTKSDFSSSSFNDFNQRHLGQTRRGKGPVRGQTLGSLEDTGDMSITSSIGRNVEQQMIMELDLPDLHMTKPGHAPPQTGTAGASRSTTKGSLVQKRSRDFATLDEAFRANFGSGNSTSNALAMFPQPSDVASSQAGASYCSALDMVMGTGSDAESVSAEVVNLGKTGSGDNRVRIAFKSKCLRTQNAWQKQLLNQQKNLLNIVSTELMDAKQLLLARDKVRDDQKEILRGFRKIVTRAWANNQARQETRVKVFIVEECDLLRAEVLELCRLLEYDTEVFRTVQEGLEAVRVAVLPDSEDIPSSPTSRIRSRWKRAVEASRPELRFKSAVLLASKAIKEAKQLQEAKKIARVLFLGATMLAHLPSDWDSEGIYTALMSEPEEFEEVGKSLLASGDAEVRERLRDIGICEYLLHPLSLDSIQTVVGEAVKRRFSDEYLLVKQLGRGAEGVVYRTKRLRDGKVFALKEINTRRLCDRAKGAVQAEAELLQELRGWPTVLYLVDAWTNNGDLLYYLLMPILEGGNLLQLIEVAANKDETIPMDRVVDWYVQTVHGLSYLHWRGILHRDVKPGNLILAADGRSLRVGDLGSAMRLPGPGPHPARHASVDGEVTTPVYASPEARKKQVYHAASDMWSLGVSFFEVLVLKSFGPCEGDPPPVESAGDAEPPLDVAAEIREVRRNAAHKGILVIKSEARLPSTPSSLMSITDPLQDSDAREDGARRVPRVEIRGPGEEPQHQEQPTPMDAVESSRLNPSATEGTCSTRAPLNRSYSGSGSLGSAGSPTPREEMLEELIADLVDLLKEDPQQRPMAAGLVDRPNTKLKLQAILLGTGLIGPDVFESHGKEIESICADAQAAKELEDEASKIQASTYALEGLSAVEGPSVPSATRVKVAYRKMQTI